ncbi:MAG: hypothetical protein V5B60_22100, partial [Accumulibacter sp.]
KEGQDLVNLEDIATLKVDFRLPELVPAAVAKPGQQLEVASDALPGERVHRRRSKRSTRWSRPAAARSRCAPG